MTPLKGFFNSSIARKFWMAITGFFLITFLVVHLAVNLFLFLGEDAFNTATHFMATNPLIQVMQYVLAAGFLGHIIMGIKLTLQNKAARPVKYAYENASANATWSSRNMIITGLLVLVFLVLHLKDFFFVMKFGVVPNGDYELVTGLFKDPIYVGIYVLAFIALGLHLNHGFQSAFQSVGFQNNNWKGTLQTLGTLYSVLIALGFASIAISFFFIG